MIGVLALALCVGVLSVRARPFACVLFWRRCMDLCGVLLWCANLNSIGLRSAVEKARVDQQLANNLEVRRDRGGA